MAELPVKENYILLASAARTTSGNSDILSVGKLGSVEKAMLQLDVTAASTLVGDTCNVYIQSSVDAGTNWDDFISFTQVLGNGGTLRHIVAWITGITPAAMHLNTDATLAAGTIRLGPVGAHWRVKWVIVGTGSFTFSVKCTAS